MKSLNIFILAAFTLLTFQSCTDFITEEPATFYSEKAVFSTEAGVETAVNGLYASMNNGAYYGTSWHNGVLPHSGLFFSTQAAGRDIASLNATPSNITINDLWEQAYTTINSANIVIQNLENPTSSVANKQTALGDAYFLRGMTYLDLVRLFNGVPLRTKPTSLDDIHLPRAKRNDVISLIISDLQKAKTLMSDAGKTKNNRPSKYAANIYLARLYIQLAGEENGDAANWEKARTELLEIYNSKKFKLTPTYAQLFTPGVENTTESIYELQYANTGSVRNSDIVRLYTPSESTFAPSNVTTFGRIRPNKEIFDAHVKQYPTDPRIASTYLFDSYTKPNGTVQQIYPKRTKGNTGFAFIRKWFDPAYNSTTTERNYIIARYADVLLMLAEVENEITGPSAAYIYVNEVLKRARDTNGDGVSDAVHPADWTGMDKNTFRNRIMNERRYELLSEGQEWFDARRRGYDYFLNNIVIPHNSNSKLDSLIDFKYPDNKRNMLLPIPLLELSGNQQVNDNDQNPGY
jgi:starch-binding outer membrane protein, SusD/RagB family